MDPTLPPGLADDDEPTAPFWMATFSDMVTLLLAFFVMLVAMSEVEVKKFEEALSYFTGRRGILQEEGLMPGIMGVLGEEEVEVQEKRYEDLARYVHEQGLTDAVEVDLTAQGIRVTFVDSIAFASGSAALAPSARDILGRVGVAARAASGVEVEGHTDDQPIGTAAYPSNWELSAARAASVVRFLLEQPGARPAQDYRAVGYGEFHPRDSNDTPAGRLRNRRIAILLRSRPLADSNALPNSGPIELPFPTGAPTLDS